MNENEKRQYLEKYHQAKEHGVPFFPNILFKDAVISLLVFLILIGLAYFIGAPLEARANPADTGYTPRPEWYFLFLFQLLKYFPGNLEVVGVVLLPTIAIIVLFLLPFIDQGSKRHFLNRPFVTGATSLAVVGILALTYLSIREAPPPSAPEGGDPTAFLYARNCAGCHGAIIAVPQGTNLHEIIAQGQHEGMPAWSGDLTSDQIDALAGFILSPTGSQLFTQNCAACHEAPELVASSPIRLREMFELGSAFPPHAEEDIPDWSQATSPTEQTALLNFLIAPDGQRLFSINCASCHGSAVAYSGSEEELRDLISKGGLHLEMPPWKEKLSPTELDMLANYVVDPTATPAGETLFQQNCTVCHGQRIPAVQEVAEAQQIIASGGAHETMPVWGNILTVDQISALVKYTLEAASGAPVELGRQLFAQNCAACHGDLGEGGLNPTRPGDIIAPISTAEYLKTRDDFTLRAIITLGQPNFGMSPFGTAAGGPLDDSEIDAIVAFMRSWESNPPVDMPPEIPTGLPALNGAAVYLDVCAQCHGVNGEGGTGLALNDSEYQSRVSDQQIFESINVGHKATSMIAWGEILTDQQIHELVKYIRQFVKTTSEKTPEPAAGPLTFAADVLPIFEAQCNMCHGTSGGWNATTYEKAMTTGDNAPAIIPGDAEGSLLVQKMLGTQTMGLIMPPSGKIADADIQLIIDWINAGAPE